MQYSLEQTSLRRTALTLLNIDQANGIDCPGCEWPEPDPASATSTNTAKTAPSASTMRRPPVGLRASFFRRYPVSELAGMSGMWLNHQGRLTEPMVKRPGSDYYEPIGPARLRAPRVFARKGETNCEMC
jgi:anaerobic selenocysteine-containing dehydrogenase